MYAGSPFVLLVERIKPYEIFLRMAGNLGKTSLVSFVLCAFHDMVTTLSTLWSWLARKFRIPVADDWQYLTIKRAV